MHVSGDARTSNSAFDWKALNHAKNWWQTIPVFHVKFLSASPDGPYVSAAEALLHGPVYGKADSTDAEYELQRIVDRRFRYKFFEYLVEYKGYPLARDYDWRPESELLETAPVMLKEFTELYEIPGQLEK